MIDHVGIAVSDAERSRIFYDELLAAIGLQRLITIPAADNPGGGEAHGYGRDDDPFFWIGDNEAGEIMEVRVSDRTTVRAIMPRSS